MAGAGADKATRQEQRAKREEDHPRTCNVKGHASDAGSIRRATPAGAQAGPETARDETGGAVA